MVENQQLRWFRTTLLGRTPGWSPPWPAVGPWRPVRLEVRSGADVRRVAIQASLRAGDGEVAVSVTVQLLGGASLRGALLSLRGPVGERAVEMPLGRDQGEDGTITVSGLARVPGARPWWPHTHGEQPLYAGQVLLDVGTSPAEDAGRLVAVDLGRIGFRSVSLASGDGEFALSVNGVSIFCRGACWMPVDAATLAGDREAYRRALTAARDAGMNMLRVSGTTVYEADAFYDLCDELGIMVWQDFMFANLDYPEDESFVAGVREEARQALLRWQGRPSITLLCGDSEGEQQAAMWGAPPAAWQRTLFRETLPAIARRELPDVPYWPSSASGGAFPHQPNAGSTSYYGVGAYLRPLEDARRSEVRFASECLAFANVPEDAVWARLKLTEAPRPHTPAWKSGVPRDLGAGWDFDDVRDFYLRTLFGVDPTALRSTDPERYLALGRITSGEVMEAAFAEWRRARSTCRGALIWFLRDLVAGAGWGVLDVDGTPKAAYHYLRRSLRPLAVFFSDEGLNGTYVHVVNERAEAWQGTLRVRLYQHGETPVGTADLALNVPGRSGHEFSVAALLGGFTDTAYAYRFGPAGHDVAAAALISGAGLVESDAFHFPVGRPSGREGDLGMQATVAPLDGDRFTLAVRSKRFAYAVALNVPGFAGDDDYFSVAPGEVRSVILRRAGATGAPRGSVQAMNARTAAKLAVVEGGAKGESP